MLDHGWSPQGSFPTETLAEAGQHTFKRPGMSSELSWPSSDLRRKLSCNFCMHPTLQCRCAWWEKQTCRCHLFLFLQVGSSQASFSLGMVYHMQSCEWSKKPKDWWSLLFHSTRLQLQAKPLITRQRPAFKPKGHGFSAKCTSLSLQVWIFCLRYPADLSGENPKLRNLSRNRWSFFALVRCSLWIQQWWDPNISSWTNSGMPNSGMQGLNRGRDLMIVVLNSHTGKSWKIHSTMFRQS